MTCETGAPRRRVVYFCIRRGRRERILSARDCGCVDVGGLPLVPLHRLAHGVGMVRMRARGTARRPGRGPYEEKGRSRVLSIVAMQVLASMLVGQGRRGVETRVREAVSTGGARCITHLLVQCHSGYSNCSPPSKTLSSSTAAQVIANWALPFYMRTKVIKFICAPGQGKRASLCSPRVATSLTASRGNPRRRLPLSRIRCRIERESRTISIKRAGGILWELK